VYNGIHVRTRIRVREAFACEGFACEGDCVVHLGISI